MLWFAGMLPPCRPHSRQVPISRDPIFIISFLAESIYIKLYNSVTLVKITKQSNFTKPNVATLLLMNWWNLVRFIPECIFRTSSAVEILMSKQKPVSSYEFQVQFYLHNNDQYLHFSNYILEPLFVVVPFSFLLRSWHHVDGTYLSSWFVNCLSILGHLWVYEIDK